MMLIHLAASNLSSLVSTTTSLLEKLGGLVLIAVVGWKSLGFIAQGRSAAAIALFVGALIPAAFLLDAGGMESFMRSTIKSIGG